MSDLISREVTIDEALTFFIEYLGGAFDEDNQRLLAQRMKSLPSAEPEPVCEDCISRQDVMEALDRIGSLDTEADREYAKGIFDNIPPVTPTERTGEWGERQLEHDREWIIGCIKHDGFIKTDRFDKANQIILDALQTEVVRCKDCKNWRESHSEEEESYCYIDGRTTDSTGYCSWGERR